MKKLLALGFSTAIALALATGVQAQDKKQLAFVVNAASDFWKLAEAGVKKAQGEFRTTNFNSSIRRKAPLPCRMP